MGSSIQACGCVPTDDPNPAQRRDGLEEPLGDLAAEEVVGTEGARSAGASPDLAPAKAPDECGPFRAEEQSRADAAKVGLALPVDTNPNVTLSRALAECKLLRAEELSRAKEGVGPPESMGRLARRAALVRRVRSACSPPAGSGWTRIEMKTHPSESWYRWTDNQTSLEVVSRWEAPGTLLQQLASIRDSDALEALWGGTCWQMSSQHGEGSTLSCWMEKLPVLGKRYEVVLERVFCNCLDEHAAPCWVVGECAPDVEGFARFSGPWEGFEIPAPVSGTVRSAYETGRVIEPLLGDRCRMTCACKIPVPSALRWVCTDFMLSQVIRSISSAGFKSWNRVLAEWGSCGIDGRIEKERGFYDVVRGSADAYLARVARAAAPVIAGA
mmetsp:Transcript_19225/g.57735  ORF Transcript_19225/g.57735 Transcript_19225/m.57735 type:complete len:384 (+) Transcript_19225:41-1192(+)